jgi:hypothetical protein
MELETLDIKPITSKPVVMLKNLKKNKPVNAIPKGEVFAEIVEEVGQEVFNYLERFNLTKESNIIYLSSVHHYLYGLEELKVVDVVLNFRLLNKVPHLWYFMLTMNHILPVNGYFSGCFLDYQREKKAILESKPSMIGYIMLYGYKFFNRIIPQIPVLNKIQLFFNHGRLQCLTVEEVRALLHKGGFRIIDMTGIDDVTFFIAQKANAGKERTFSLLKIWNNFRNKSRIKNI